MIKHKLKESKGCNNQSSFPGQLRSSSSKRGSENKSIHPRLAASRFPNFCFPVMHSFNYSMVLTRTRKNNCLVVRPLFFFFAALGLQLHCRAGLSLQALEYKCSGFGTWAQLPRGMWDLSSRSAMSSALEDRFLTTGPPGISLVVEL